MTESNVVVVDTNVWLDYLFGDRPNHKAAKTFMDDARGHETPLVIAPHSLSDVFFIAQQKFKFQNRQDGKQTPEVSAASARAGAWAIIDLIMDLATVGPSDQMDAIMASKSRAVHNDFEDNLVVACAMRTGARLLVTNDEQLIRHSPVAAMSASDALALLEAEA